MSEENRALKEKIREMEQRQKLAVDLFREGNVYYQKTAEGKKFGPFCMACWDGDGKLINVIWNQTEIATIMKCGRCAKSGT